MSLRIQLLGQARITLDGQPVDLPGYRPLALLTYLILTRKAYSRQHLIDLLFDGPDDPRAALRWTLSKLRKAIGEAYILADRDEVSFNFQSDYWLDVSAFEAGDSELYQGDLLEGLYLRDAFRFEEWLLFERQRLRGQVQTALEGQLEQHMRQGDAAAVAITTQHLLKLDNLREDWHRILMESYARLGKRAAALEQYEECRRLLRKEWGVDPEPETVALAEAIRRGQIGAEATPMDSGMRYAAAPSVPNGQVAVPVRAAPEIQPRKSLARPVLLLIGMIGLAAVLLFAWTMANNSNDPSVFSEGGSSATPGNTSQPEAAAPEFAGTTVYILGPFFDNWSLLFQESMTPFEERTGIDVTFLTGERPYETYLAEKLENGAPADIVILAQPGWMEQLSRQGKTVDLRTFLDDEYLRQQIPEIFLDLASVDGKLVGIWYTLGLKSLVWYPKQAFEAKGYQVPQTWEELIALSDQIVADGGVPWCIGIQGDDFTGWVGTDWVEDILLGTATPETYDAWVKGKLPFNSPEIRRVFEIMEQIWMNEDYIYGGRATILKEDFTESPAHLFEDPPGCYLNKQASFAAFFFPEGGSYGEDYDFFYLPPIDPQYGKPVLGSGDVFVMLNDRPEVREVMRYLTTAEATKAMIQSGNFLSPHKSTPLEWFPTEKDLRFAQIVLGADAYRFDGSDLMPAEVGLGSFYRGVTDWVEGVDLDTVLQEIDASWPR